MEQALTPWKLGWPHHTKRLILRPYEQRDLIPLWSLLQDSDNLTYQGWKAPANREAAQQALDLRINSHTAATQGEWLMVALERQHTGQFIGDVVFQRLDEAGTKAKIGYTLAREHQGHGFATEACRFLLDLLCYPWRVETVTAEVRTDNAPSCALLTRLGFDPTPAPDKDGHSYLTFTKDIRLRGPRWRPTLGDWLHDVDIIRPGL